MANACVIGSPVAHSLSPVLHNYWLEKYSIKGGYDAQEVSAKDLQFFLKSMPEKGYKGCSVTIPHKQSIIPLLDKIDDIAQTIGAVNVVVINDDGSLGGMNTDAYGFIENLKASVAIEKKERAVVLGAGGAAYAVVKALIDNGYKQIILTNRTQENAKKLAEKYDGRVLVEPWEGRHNILAGADLLINTTSLGLAGNPPLELKLDGLEKTAVVYDIVYNPLLTPLLSAAKNRGNKIVSGMGMLVYQAVPAFEVWFGRRPQVDAQLIEKLEQSL